MASYRDLALLTFLYLIQGLPYGFQSRFMPIYLRTKRISLTKIGLFKLLLIPWLCKALWAPFVDRCSTKRKWLLGSIFGMVGVCLIASLVSLENMKILCAVLFSMNFFAATQDIAVDGIAVGLLSNEDLAIGNTGQVVGFKLGSVLGGGILVSCMDHFGWSGVFLALGLLYVFALLFVFMSSTIQSFDSITEPMQQTYTITTHSVIKETLSVSNDPLVPSEAISFLQEQDLSLVSYEGGDMLNGNDTIGIKDFHDENTVSANYYQYSLSKNSHCSNEEVSEQEVVGKSVPCSHSYSEEDVHSDYMIEGQFDDAEDDDSDVPLTASKLTTTSSKISPTKTSILRQRGKTASPSKPPVNVVKPQQQAIRQTAEVDPNISVESSHHNRESKMDSIPNQRHQGPCKCETKTEAERLVWVPEMLSFLRETWEVPGTQWMIVYILLYKLGEQGALGTLPLFLVDKKLPAGDVTFWTGIVGQVSSILGSLIGGLCVTRARYVIPPHLFLHQMSLLRLMPLGVQLWIVAISQWESEPSNWLVYSAVGAMQVMLFISGIITTATFTLMMTCSQNAPPHIQATHYTTLATVEVFGKLTFASISGWLVDVLGYGVMYLVYTLLCLVILPWFPHCPTSLIRRRPKTN